MKTRSNGAVALRLFLCLTLICGGLYPALVTILGQWFFPQQANGSLLLSQGRILGSRLLAQKCAEPGYFQSRPSACNYNTLPGTATNFAPSSAGWRDSVKARRNRFYLENHLADSVQAPVEMLCASASGLDPHISPAAARMQVARIVASRGNQPHYEKTLLKIIDRYTQPRQGGLLGRPCINVLELNFILDNSREFCNLIKQ